jgi:FlaA1/EpsC-like NDP-sugar epimerase
MTVTSITFCLVALAAMVCSFALSALVLRWARAGWLQDVPNERSLHSRTTPRGAGIGIVFITLVGLSISYPFVGGLPPLVFVGFLTGGTITAVVSLWDDAHPLSPLVRLAIQTFVAALTVWTSGFAESIHFAALPGWDFAWPARFIAVFWIVGFTNAYNFMDGIDGIAGLQGAVAGLAFAALGWYAQMPWLSIAGLLLGASSIGFLGHNWHPARIFMGDVGSTFLGYSFAALALIAGSRNPILLFAAILPVFPFVFDSSFTFVRRLLRGENVFHAHRSHLYQRLVIAGLSHDVVASFYGLLSALGAVIAVVLVARGHAQPHLLMALPAACVCLILTVAGVSGSLHTILDKSRVSQRSFSAWLNRLERINHLNRVGTWTIQAFVFAAAGFCAFLLRFDFAIPGMYQKHILVSILIWVAVKSIVFRLHGLDRGWWHYVSIHDLIQLTASNLTGSLCSMVFIIALGLPTYPRSIYLIDFLLTLLATTGIRLSVRMATDMLAAVRATESLKRVLIYGAGRAGTILLREIRSNPRMNYQMIGFIDDNPEKQGLVVHGARILGAGENLVGVAQKHHVEEILIALPSVSGPRMTSIIRSCQDAGVRCRTIPPLDEILDHRNLASQIRDVDVEDLLGRTPVQLDEEEILQKLEGRAILVTGAGGSIGSELCRQIARFNPRLIIGFDVAETALFHLNREMRAKFPSVDFMPAIGSVQSRSRLSQIFRDFMPTIVYHAAAYKHVPLMESHVAEAVENNLFGTYQVALAASENGVTDFVMISSDKAVRPTNIMGATKRAAELLIGSMQNNSVTYVSVRFGNVLGSNGSVVPLFKEQIAAGGPVTVTDPDMERYFMTIPEATQLVLQASTMGQGGEIFVLDMGSPMKIIDLARNLILLSGFQPDQEIKIEITGARPGEKLREELHTLEEDTVPTRHPKIKIFQRKPVAAEWMMRHLDELQDLCNYRNTPALVERLKRIVPEYDPGACAPVRIAHPKTRSANV